MAYDNCVDYFDDYDDHFYDFDYCNDNIEDHDDHWNCLNMHVRYVIITMTLTYDHDSGSWD